MVTKIKFFWFLFRNKALIKWYKNFKEDKEYPSLRKFFKGNGSHNWIANAFIWKDTLDGYTYWDNLDSKWTDKTMQKFNFKLNTNIVLRW